MIYKALSHTGEISEQTKIDNVHTDFTAKEILLLKTIEWLR